MKLDLKRRFNIVRTTLDKKTKQPRARLAAFIQKKPFLSLYSLLGLLLLLIVLSNIIGKPKEKEEQKVTVPKKISVYRIGESPKIKVQAQVEKSGVITITALSPGVVQNINVEPGSYVTKGATLLSTSPNYQGGNALALQASIAGRQLQNINDTYDTQKELISKQKEIANKSAENSEELRDITSKSVDETQGVIDVNDNILKIIDELDQNTSDDYEGITAPNNIRLTVLQLRTQFLSANNQLRSALRNAEYQSGSDNPPAELANLQKDVTLKQLEIQEKALDLQRDVSRLQYQAASVQAAMMAPVAPFNGTVQRVNVKIGQAVNPGTPLIVISQDVADDPIVGIAYVPRDIAQKVSFFEPSKLTIGNVTYESYPSYVTQDAIKGTLYGVYYPIPDMYNKMLTDTGYMNVELNWI
jgi:multidrug resistance efflux pump